MPSGRVRENHSGFAAALALLLLVGPAIGASAEGSASEGAPSPNSVASGPFQWYDPQRVTNNSEPDFQPQVWVDSGGSVHLIWRKGTGIGQGYYVATGGLTTGIVSGPYYITDHVSHGLGGASIPVARNIARDANGNFHVAYESTWENITYTKYNATGRTVVSERNVGPIDSYSSRMPSLTITPDGAVHSAHIEEGFQVNDIVYDKLQNDGTDIWIDRVVTSDIGPLSASTPVIKADPFHGNIVFTIGSNRGLYLSRFNTYGTKDLPNVRLRLTSDLKAADVASAPNGSMHVAWIDGGIVHYSMVNVTGVKIVDGYQLAGNGSALGVPRLAAGLDGTVNIVWEEDRSGTSQIMIARIGQNQTPGQVVPVQVTNSTGGASQPDVAVTVGSAPVVAWVDTRDGNQEVYYALGAEARCEITADPIDIATMFFIHPNETKVLPLSGSNKGSLSDDYTVRVEHDAPTGWTVDLSPTVFPALGPGGRASFNLTVSVPLSAPDGQNATFRVVLESQHGACRDELVIPMFVQFSRELRLTGQTQKSGKNGETITYGLFIRNSGDIREEDIHVEWLQGVGENWPVTVIWSNASLDPGEATNFTVRITIPADAPGSVPGLFQIVAYSGADPTVRTTIQLTLIPATAIEVIMAATPDYQLIRPGGTGKYQINVTHRGNLPIAVKIDIVAQKPTIYPGWLATIDRNVVYLRGGESTYLTLHIYVPPGEPAGTSVSLVVSGFSQNYAAEGRVTVEAEVARVCDLSMTVGPMADLTPGQQSTAQVILNTTANYNLTAIANVTGLPPGWTASAVGAVSGSPLVDLVAEGSSSLVLSVLAPAGTVAGDYPFEITAIGEGCTSANATRSAHVRPVGGFAATIDTYRPQGLPGEHRTVHLSIENQRNDGQDLWVQLFDRTGYLGQFQPILLERLGEGEGDIAPLIDGHLQLGPGANASVEILLQVPLNPDVSSDEFVVRVVDQRAQEAIFSVTLEVLHPDLEVAGAGVVDGEPVTGTPIHLAATVSNRGQVAGGTGFVEMRVDGTQVFQQPLASVAPGESVVFTFTWNATPGLHNITFTVVVTGGVAEIDTGNDALLLPVYVGGPRGEVEGETVSATSIVALSAAIAGAAVGVILLMRWKRRLSETRK